MTGAAYRPHQVWRPDIGADPARDVLVFEERDERFGVTARARVPCVDCVNSMSDPTIPLTINEWDEWGDPRDPAARAYLESYSPYDITPAGERPDLLVT